MSYTLGMVGPITVADFKEYIYPGEWREGLPTGQGGTPVNLLCRELLRRGQKLVVFTCDAAVRDEIVLNGDLLRLCIGPKGSRPARDFFTTERKYLTRAILRERPDILHAQWTYEYAMPVQRIAIPHVITAHDTPLRYMVHQFIPFRIAKTAMAYRVIARARKIVSVSPYVHHHLRRYAFYRGPERVIPNGMPDSAFVAPRARPANAPIVFASILVGWGGYKNGAIAIRAFAQYRQAHPDARLLMFGSGHGPGEQAQAWASSHGIGDGIEFIGQQPYPHLLRRLEQEVDILVHPSLVEAQPMALIEAMARGIAVIGGRSSGGVPWTLGDGEAGRLVDVQSADAMASAMRELGENPALRRDIAQRGQRLAHARFHIAAVADAWQSVYDELAQLP